MAETNEGTVCPIQTFVFLDIETTGLPDYNFGKANITELAMWTLSREDLRKSTETPRLLGKWTTVFNPGMMIHPESSRITGLYNEMLEHHAKFDDDAATAILSYLKRYPKPICLIAHNGNGFDFPIIKQSFEKVKKEIPDFLLCVDSLDILRELDSIAESMILDLLSNPEISEGLPSQTAQEISETNTSNKENSVAGPTKSDLSVDDQNELFDEKNTKILERQRVNETTPRRSIQEKYVKKFTQPIEKNTRGQTDGNVKPSKARKELFPPVQVATGRVGKLPRKSFKLVDIYERIYDHKPISAHAAEADVETLFKIARNYGVEFVKLAERDAIPFAQFKKPVKK